MSTSSLAEPMVAIGDATPDRAEGEVPATSEHAPLIPRHPVFLVALAGVPLLVFGSVGFDAQGLIAAFTAGVLIALAAIDLEHRVLPDRIVLPATGVVLVAQIAFFTGEALGHVLAGLAAAAFLALPLLVRRDAMGIGDLKLALFIGVATGWSVFGAIVVGCLATLPVAIWMMRRDGSIRNATVPFGPFLAFGTLVILFTS